MKICQLFARLKQHSWIIIFILITVVATACSPEPTPPPVAQIPTETPPPTATTEPTVTLEPTNTPIVPEANVLTSPIIEGEIIITGQSIVIQLILTPDVEIAEANWEFISGNGMLDPSTGEAIAFTAPSEPEAVIIKVSGTTSEGVPFEVIKPFSVVEPTPTPLPPRPTRAPCNDFTSLPNNRTSLPLSPISGIITDPIHCSINLTPQEALPVGGTALDVPDGKNLWLFVYAKDGRYYPQCDDALDGRCGANYSQGTWSVITFLGRPNCKEQFNLVLVSTDNANNNMLLQTMKEWAEAESFAGFTTGDVLDLGITEIDSIIVETKGNPCP